MKKLIYWAVVVAMFVSCKNSQDEPKPQPEDTKIPINITTSIMRATDSAFELGDKVGIYVVNSPNQLAASGNHVDNMGFTYSPGWTPDKEIYWKDETTQAAFYCYYPYTQNVSTTNHKFIAKADQSSVENYKASEFLWGKTNFLSPTESAVPITVNHTFSNALVVVEPGDGFTAESLAASNVEVKLCNLKTEATINMATGEATAGGAPTTIKPLNEGTYYRALVVPQTVEESALIIVTIDGVSYTLTKGFTFKPNTQHRFTVTVNKVSNGVNIGIGGWEIDETDNGGVAE